MTKDSKRRAILFDLDGTLIDTLTDLGNAMNETLRNRGAKPLEIASYRQRIGHGLEHIARLAKEESQCDGELSELVAEFRQNYANALIVESRPYPGILQLIENLRDTPTKLAVLSNKSNHLTIRIATHFFGGDTFDRVIGSHPSRPRKPDPSAALDIARYFDEPPNQCLLIGDSATDAETARRAGMQFIGVSWGFKHPEEMRKHGADTIVDTVEDLRHLIDRWIDRHSIEYNTFIKRSS